MWKAFLIAIVLPIAALATGQEVPSWLFPMDAPGDAPVSSPLDPSVAKPDETGESGEAATGKKPQSSDSKGPSTNPCATSHKGVFYDNDFNYLLDPDYHGNCFGDCLKLTPVDNCGCWGTVDVGGQLRLRFHHERGMGQQINETRFEPTVNDFLLERFRLFTNWNINENVRIFAEGIFADVTADPAYLPRPIDIDRGDFLNLFVDLKLLDTLTFRAGRQELLYGAQRLVSPLDWANTRRTFQGLKLLYREDDWAIDGFYTHHVPVDSNGYNEVDYKQSFYGMYGVYSGFENRAYDFFYLGYDNRHTGGPPASDDFSLHTFGSRVFGQTESMWLYEAIGAVQLGRQSGLGLDQEAGMATAGVGRELSTTGWKPTLWVYFDYASGNAGAGSFNRFNQLFPLGHKYLGFIDAVQRSNIESPNVLLTMRPQEKISLLFWYYHFMANQPGDIVPSFGGTPPQSLASSDFGNELDFIVTCQIGPRSNVLLGYSHFWRGSKILAPSDADFIYSQWELNF